MKLEKFKDELGNFAKDIKLNLSTVLTEEGSPGLTKKQVGLTALSCAYAIESSELIDVMLDEFQSEFNDTDVDAAKGAAVIMAMNNAYFRGKHLLGSDAINGLPARLRMNIIANPGIEKVDFELMSLAISVLGGCEMCLKSHLKVVKSAGVGDDGAHSALRIASVLSAAKLARSINS